MQISIVTAVFNRVGTIAEALESVSAQTHPNIQHIVQDGGSTDGTLEAIKDMNGSSISLVSERDSGIYDAINRGIARASGDVVGLMHSDDFLAHENIISSVATAFQDPSVDCLYGDLQYVSSSNTSRVVRHWVSGPYDRARLKRGWMPPHPTFYIRRGHLEKFGLYDTHYQIAADYDAMLRWLWTHRLKPAYLPEVMVKMRTGGESNRSLSRILQKSREDLRALKSNGVGGIGALAMKNASKVKQLRSPDPRSSTVSN